MNEKIIDLYVEQIMRHVINWKERLKLTEESGFKVNDKNLDSLRKKLKPLIEKIFEEKKEHLLTEEFCYYLVYESFKMVDYQKQLINSLNNIIKADDKELKKILSKYMHYVCFNDIYHFDKQENYINLMNQESLSAFNTCQNCINNMYRIPIRGFESTILTEILFDIYAYCAINKKLNDFDNLVKKYFVNPRQTIDHFVNNGFMKKDYDLIDNFDDFIYNDMKEKSNQRIIR